MGQGSILNISSKQKINTRSSTEAEVVAVDDGIGPMLWTHYFLEEQGYDVKDNVLLQDNQSAIKLESNGRASAGKRCCHTNIRYFFVTDVASKGLVTIQYCPTDEMDLDYHTKPLQGRKFNKFRCRIMGLPQWNPKVKFRATSSSSMTQVKNRVKRREASTGGILFSKANET